MSRPRHLRRLITLPWRSRRRIRGDIDAEFEFHLAMREAELRAAGLLPDEARATALRRFGDLHDAREYCRSMDERSIHAQQRRDGLAELGSDLRFALRQMRRSPAFTALAVVTLGLGIGATTAIFSVVDRLLLDPIPYQDGDRIVNLSRTNPRGSIFVTPTPKLLDAWRDRVPSLERVAAVGSKNVTVAGRDEPEELHAGTISADVLPLLGVQPALGRGVLPEDTKRGAAAVAWLGYGYWERRFGGDRAVIGQSLSIDGAPYTIVGVMPRDFTVPFVDGGSLPLWLPFVVDSTTHNAPAIAKMRPGVERAQVDRELTEVVEALAAESPEFKEWGGRALRPQDYLGSTTRDTLLVLMVAVAMVLLIACANVANLLLARASTRQREFAIRAALGAGRWRMVRQLLTESMLLALAGGALGLFVASRGLDVIIALRPDPLSDLDEVRLSPVVLGVSLGLTLLTGVLFGLAPALFVAARNLGDTLKSATRSAAGHVGGRRFRGALVIAEVSLSVLLLVGAGLLVRTMIAMQRADVGFTPSGLVAARLDLPEKRYPTRDQRRALYTQALQRVQAIPGVSRATMAMGVPPRTAAFMGDLEIEGRALAPSERVTAMSVQFAGPDYFATIRLPLVAGHPFSADSSGEPVIINESMARRYWPGTSPVGRRVRGWAKGPWSTIVGVAHNVTVPSTGRRGPRLDDSQMYLPFQGDFTSATVILRVDPRSTDVARRLTREMAAIDPGIRVRDVSTVTALLDKELTAPRFNMSLLLAFAVLALVLAAGGLYGVIAYSVSQRVRELGIRVALGADRSAVLRLVMAQGARLTIAGLVVGLGTAAGLTRLMQSLLYGISPRDPWTFALVGVALGVVAVVASLGPARRATRVDPVIALREE